MTCMRRKNSSSMLSIGNNHPRSRRRKLSQRVLARRLKVFQPHIARTESARHNPRISSIVKAAKAVRCHVMLVPDEELERLDVSMIVCAVGASWRWSY